MALNLNTVSNVNAASVLRVNGSAFRPRIFHQFKTPISSTFKPFLEELQQLPMKINASKTIKNISSGILNMFVDSMFQFVDQPWLPSQSNFVPVEEIGEAVEVNCIEGQIPPHFPQGIYVRNGSNPLFGAQKSAVSLFGKSNQVWVEGDGMLHALFFNKDSNGNWKISYKNKFVESETHKIETLRKKTTFIPTVEGDPIAVLIAHLLNMARYGTPTNIYQNVSVFEHSGKLYTTTENYLAQEIEMPSLQSLDTWDINGNWTGSFASHPKVAPGTGELVVMGVSAQKPYFVVGVVSADGKELLHKVDLNHDRSTLSHDIGVTQNYNVIIDHPLVIDLTRLLKGGQLIKYEKQEKARLGVMQRYGDADSIKWFEVQPNCTFHIVNCFEQGHEVIVRGCKASASIIPGPNWGEDKLEWFAKGFENSNDDENSGYLIHHVCEWKLNMLTGQVKETELTAPNLSMDFPCLNPHFNGLHHKFAYTQIIDSMATSLSGITKYGSLAKLYFDEPVGQEEENCKGKIKVEYHKLPNNVFCTGSAFVRKEGGVEEDDGWIVTFVHNENTNLSQVYIINANMFESEPIVIITLPRRVPYGFHGIFVSNMPH